MTGIGVAHWRSFSFLRDMFPGKRNEVLSDGNALCGSVSNYLELTSSADFTESSLPVLPSIRVIQNGEDASLIVATANAGVTSEVLLTQASTFSVSPSLPPRLLSATELSTQSDLILPTATFKYDPPSLSTSGLGSGHNSRNLDYEKLLQSQYTRTRLALLSVREFAQADTTTFAPRAIQASTTQPRLETSMSSLLTADHLSVRTSALTFSHVSAISTDLRRPSRQASANPRSTTSVTKTSHTQSAVLVSTPASNSVTISSSSASTQAKAMTTVVPTTHTSEAEVRSSLSSTLPAAEPVVLPTERLSTRLETEVQSPSVKPVTTSTTEGLTTSQVSAPVQTDSASKPSIPSGTTQVQSSSTESIAQTTEKMVSAVSQISTSTTTTAATIIVEDYSRVLDAPTNRFKCRVLWHNKLCVSELRKQCIFVRRRTPPRIQYKVTDYRTLDSTIPAREHEEIARSCGGYSIYKA